MTVGAPQSLDKQKQGRVFRPLKNHPLNREIPLKNLHALGQYLIQRWLQLTSPPTPPSHASITQLEQHRRAQLTGCILFLLLLIALAVFPLTIFGTLQALFPIMLASLLLTLFALVLNRLGKTLLVDILLISVFTFGFYLGLLLLFSQQQLAVNYLPTFDLLIESELFAVSLLPPAFVFLVMGSNCLFILANLSLQPRTYDLALLLKGSGFYSIALRPLMLQIVVAVVTYLWASSATRAIARANQAEESASFEHTLASEKLHLEQGVQQFLQTLIQAANGELNARTPLFQEPLLWQVATSLNTLLGRLQHLEHMEEDRERLYFENEQLRTAHHSLSQLEKELRESKRLAEDYFLLSQLHSQDSNDELLFMKGEIALLVKAINIAKTKKQPIWFRPHGSTLDPIVNNLQGNYLYPFSIPTHGQQITIIRPDENQ